MSEDNNTRLEQSIDFSKLLSVLRRSIPWILVLMLVTNLAAYMYVRYTKPLYESESIIKLEIESEANILGITTPDATDGNLRGLSGEIELLKSSLFLGRVADEIQYDVAYHFYGTYLTAERYHNSPFTADFVIRHPRYYDKNIDVEIHNQEEFTLEYLINGVSEKVSGRFGQILNLPDAEIRLNTTSHYTEKNGKGKYFFRINSRENVIKYLQRNVTVVPENFNAKTIKISLTDFNKFKAQDFVNAIDTLYLDYLKETKNQAITQKIDFLNEQIDQTNKRLEEFEDYFETFTIRNRTISLKEDLGKSIGYLERLDSQRVAYQQDLERTIRLEQMIKNGDYRVISPITAEQTSPVIQQLLGEYLSLADRRAILLESYGERTLVIQQINDQLNALSDKLTGLISEYRELVKSNINLIRRQQIAVNSNFNQLPKKGTEFDKNQRIYELNENIFLTLWQSKTELEIAKAGTVNKSVILSPATLPATPVHPRSLIVYAAGIVAGFIFSLVFVVVRYFAQNTILSVNELEQLTSVPILGSLPGYSRDQMPVSRMVVDKASRSALSESFRSLRANMDFLSPGLKSKLITVTSTVSGEGKTFVGVNLAAIIALSGARVCLMDLDMRKPKVSLAFGDEPSADKGVSTVLSGKHSVEECIRNTRIPTLDYIPAGPVPPNSSELLLNQTFTETVDFLKTRYDVIVFDTPPVGLVTDGISAMKRSDIQIYVLRAEYSKRQFVKNLNNLARANKFTNLTTILNAVSRTEGQGGYGYNYSYGYYEDTEEPGRVRKFLNRFF